MTVRYPTGWVIDVQQPGSVIVATSQEVLDLEDNTVPSGEAALAIAFIDDEQGILRDYLDSGDLMEMMNNLTKNVFEAESDPQLVFTEPSSMTFMGFAAVRSDAVFLGTHVFIIMSERDDMVFNFVIGLTAAAEFDKFEPKLLAIAESAQYMPHITA